MITTVLCLLIISIVLVWLWSYLEKYENSTPQHYIDEFIELLYNDDISEVMTNAGVEKTTFFNASDYKKYITDTLGNDISAIVTYEVGEESGKKLYELSSNAKDAIRIELTEEKNGSDDGFSSYTVKHIDISYNEMIIRAPEYVTVLANGIKLTDKYETESIAKSNFLHVKDKSFIPKFNEYKISGFIHSPIIEVDKLDKSRYKIDGESDITITIYPPTDEKSKIEAIASNAAKSYAKFISKDGSFSDYAKYLLKESEYYNIVRGFDNNWYIEHDGFGFESFSVQNVIEYSQKAYSAEVKFDYVIKRKNIRRVYNTNYKISFIKVGDSYKIVNLEVL